MLKSQEFSTCQEPLLPRMNKWEIPNLQTIRYIKTNILEVAHLSYRVELDPVATSYFVGCIERTRNIPD